VRQLAPRNQAALGAVTLVVLTLATVLAYRADRLPFFGGGSSYTAMFAEAAGLGVDDEVRVAGIKVGKVTDMRLGRGVVLVRFQAGRVRLGDQSRVSIQIKTLLGDKFLAVVPAGARPQDPAAAIPVARTSTPFEVPDAFNQLGQTLDRIDTTQLAQSFQVLSDTFAHTPDSIGGALTGLSRLSASIASRDAALSSLLASASNVSGVVAQRNQQVSRLITDGSRLLDELDRRKTAINELLVGTERLADQLRGLVRDNNDQIRPALRELDRTTELLRRNNDALEHGIASMALYERLFSNVVGTGRWFDGYFCGLLNPTISAGGLVFNPGTCAPPKPLAPAPTGLGPLLGGQR
jgi:phospholipid/cholesterol/gamma-HCH transport system substrate-binding protein